MSEKRPSSPIRRLFLGTALGAVVGLGAVGCDATGPTDDLEGERARLEQARGQWRAQNIVDYQFTFRRNCFCGPDVRDPALVMVRGGTVASVASVATGAPRDPALYYTIEELFDLLEDAIDQQAARLSATYHSSLGYPTSAFIDRNEMIADEELGFEATDLQPR
jgi:hypothetical protein